MIRSGIYVSSSFSWARVDSSAVCRICIAEMVSVRPDHEGTNHFGGARNPMVRMAAKLPGRLISSTVNVPSA